MGERGTGRGLLAGRRVILAERLLEPDWALLDRYQAFSAELLRMALAGFAGFGLLLAALMKETSRAAVLGRPCFLGPAGAALGLLATAAALALAHRYLSADGLAEQVRAARLIQLRSDLSEDWPRRSEADTAIAHGERRRDRAYKACGRLLLGATVALGLGTVLLGASLLVVLLMPG